MSKCATIGWFPLQSISWSGVSIDKWSITDHCSNGTFCAQMYSSRDIAENVPHRNPIKNNSIILNIEIILG